MSKRPIILYMEDDADDVEILSGAFEIVAPNCAIINAINGEEGIEKLHILITENNTPGLIILDINMPRMNGKDTIVALKKEKRFNDIPIVVLSTSSSKMDRLFFDKHGVKMLSKPMSFTDYLTIARELISYCQCE